MRDVTGGAVQSPEHHRPCPTATVGEPLLLPVDQVPQQNDTDRNYIRQLAAGNGYIFNIRPSQVPMTRNASIATGSPARAAWVTCRP